ncbi:40S ribosomal protein S27-2 [Platanthera guangdongensis]|uniref:40S ribosomal protein S27 n=1 Tax=Platanthera guangdongensis TaxID=2320717 RepID=A0ABR2LFG8_9ASPA
MKRAKQKKKKKKYRGKESSGGRRECRAKESSGPARGSVFLGFLGSSTPSGQDGELLGSNLRSLFYVLIYVLQNDIDLLNPPADLEKRKHKLKRLVQSPNSFFMDVKCQGCFNITTVFSHSQTVVVCGNCQTVLCQPTGGKARLTEGCSFRRKGD